MSFVIYINVGLVDIEDNNSQKLSSNAHMEMSLTYGKEQHGIKYKPHYNLLLKLDFLSFVILKQSYRFSRMADFYQNALALLG